jgi:hypothetical protein
MENKQLLWLSGSCRGRSPDLGVRAGAGPLSPSNPGVNHGDSQRPTFIEAVYKTSKIPFFDMIIYGVNYHIKKRD